MEILLMVGLLGALVALAIAMAFLNDLLVVTMLSGIFSFTCCALFVLFDAPDVAFTEACVGAGVSTVLIITALRLTGRQERRRGRPASAIGVGVCVLTGLALAYGTLELPRFGDARAPAQGHVAPHYLLESGTEIAIPNVVTSVLASYRGYDTLGEVVVVFTAGLGVLLLIGGAQSLPHGRGDAPARADRDVVLRAVASLFVPMTLFLAPYVQFHGAYSPGGGFQAGAILGGALILFGLVFGVDRLNQLVPERVLRAIMALGVLTYGGTGLATLALGHNFLDYDAFGSRPTGQQIGITVIEAGVFMTVACVMTLLYQRFASRASAS
jgi:multicomponent Na+:H+ antiporter subunit B